MRTSVCPSVRSPEAQSPSDCAQGGLGFQRGRSEAVQRTGWQRHGTFLNRQLRVRRTRMGLARPLQQASILISPGQWCGPRTLARPEPGERPRGDIPGVTWEEGAEVGTGRAQLACASQDPGPGASTVLTFLPNLGPWTSGCGCGPSAQYTALKPLPQSP